MEMNGKCIETKVGVSRHQFNPQGNNSPRDVRQTCVHLALQPLRNTAANRNIPGIPSSTPSQHQIIFIPQGKDTIPNNPTQHLPCTNLENPPLRGQTKTARWTRVPTVHGCAASNPHGEHRHNRHAGHHDVPSIHGVRQRAVRGAPGVGCMWVHLRTHRHGHRHTRRGRRRRRRKKTRRAGQKWSIADKDLKSTGRGRRLPRS